MNILTKLIKLMWKENKAIFIMSVIFTILSATFTMMQAEIGQALFSAINIAQSSKLKSETIEKLNNDKLNSNKNEINDQVIIDEYNNGLLNNDKEEEKEKYENKQNIVSKINLFKLFFENLGKIKSTKDFLTFIFMQKSLVLVIITGILFILFYLLLKFFLYMQGYLQSLLAFKASINMQKQMFDKLLTLPSLFFKSKAKAGDLITRIINDINNIRIASMNIFNMLFFIPILVVFSIIMLFIKNHLFTFILIISGAIGIIFINIIAKLVKHQVVQSSKRLAGTASYINQTIYGIDAIKVYNTEKYEKKQFSSLLDNYIKAYKKLLQLSLLERPVTEILGVLIFILILISGALLFWQSKLTIDQIIGFLLYLIVLAPNIQNVSRILFQLNSAEGSNQRLEEILKMENESKYFGNEKLKNFNGNLDFKNIYFSYSYQNEISEIEYALYDISIKIKEGEFVAIVGPSGAGKSTFINLIPALLIPTKGTIYFDNIDYKTLSLSEIRKHIAIVPQDVVLFPDTIYNNILFGRLDAKEEEVYYYSKLANADSFIKELPEGYNTILGERGLTISGGQKQRIAIARALLKNPKVLIFDEATSSLDSESERAIQNAMESIMHKQTLIVIAHRLSTVLKADRIIVLNKGRIVEVGNHEELLNKNGLYTSLYNSQFNT